jgi:hypothetical protein
MSGAGERACVEHGPAERTRGGRQIAWMKQRTELPAQLGAQDYLRAGGIRPGPFLLERAALA